MRQRSSTVERSPHKAHAVGSTPTAGTTLRSFGASRGKPLKLTEVCPSEATK